MMGPDWRRCARTICVFLRCITMNSISFLMMAFSSQGWPRNLEPFETSYEALEILCQMGTRKRHRLIAPMRGGPARPSHNSDQEVARYPRLGPMERSASSK